MKPRGTRRECAMFPRVLGEWAGRLAGYTCTGFNYLRQSTRDLFSDESAVAAGRAFRYAAESTALLLIAPPVVRPLVAAYRAWNFVDRLQTRPSAAGSQAPSSAMESGLACYLNALGESDPLLVSPAGTLPLQRCLERP